MVSRLIPAASAAQQMEAFRWAVQDYVEDGVTTAVIAGGSSGSLTDLRKARSEDVLTFRIITMMSRGNPGQLSAAEAGGLGSHFGDSRLKVGAIKIVQDGSNQGYTGHFTEPYYTPFKGDADYRGYPRRSREDLTTMVKELHRAGYQIAIHANGDAAIDDVIHAFRKPSRSIRERMHGIESSTVRWCDRINSTRSPSWVSPRRSSSDMSTTGGTATATSSWGPSALPGSARCPRQSTAEFASPSTTIHP